MSADDLIDEVELLLSAREWPPRIAHRLGYASPWSLAVRLRAAGRADLARRFDYRKAGAL